jgi:hypothetical protein
MATPREAGRQRARPFLWCLPDGVIFGMLWVFSRVVIEVDCLEVVNLRNSLTVSCSVVASILLKIEGLTSIF